MRGTLRHRLSHLLRAEGGFVTARNDAAEVLLPLAEAEMRLPAVVGDYTDFYASLFHATNVGQMLRPDNPLLPNYKWVPIGYHGRASSLVVSGTAIARPQGQTEPAEGGEPRFGPTRSLDYELEVAAFLGPGNPLGAPIPIGEAESHICSGCACSTTGRPATSRSGSTSRSARSWPRASRPRSARGSSRWRRSRRIAPGRSRAPRATRSRCPTSSHAEDREHGGIDLRLEVLLATQAMRERGLPPFRVSRSNLRDVYWTLAQMVAHHSSNGCNLRPGRPDRERHRLGPRAGESRLPDRAHLARQGAAGAAERRGAPLPRGRATR